MDNKITNIELNFSNICTARCYCCSNHRGKKNIPLMADDIFKKVLEQLKEIQFDRIHTSGCGEGLVNINYPFYLRDLRKEFPKAIIDYYSNFSLMIPSVSNYIIKKKLLNEMHISIDGVERWVFEKATGLEYDTVFKNIDYFLKNNDCIEVFINYRNPRKYYERCRDILNREPLFKRYVGDDVNNLKNEYNEIQARFNSVSKMKITYSNTAFSLWGERDDCEPDFEKKHPCPKLNVIKNTIWIDPDGSVRMCPYQEEQGGRLVYGT